MKILYDYQMFEMQKYGGVTRYFIELLTRMLAAETHRCELPIRYSSNEYLKNLTPIWRSVLGGSDFFHAFAWGLSFKGKRRLFNFCEKHVRGAHSKMRCNKNLSIEALKRGAFNIFHPTYYDPYFLPYLGKTPFVLTVHDMIHDLYPQYFPPSDPTVANKKLLCQKAAMIVAVSKRTKSDLMELYKVEDSKIKVIYHGSSFVQKKRCSPPLHADPYVLFVGNRTSYKNFAFMVKALAMEMRRSNISLVCAGGGAFTHLEMKLLKDLGVENLAKHVAIDNERLCNLYRHARAFIFPSLYEGFGIPVLEAFSCGCPCLLSAGGSLPEVGGDAVLYFDPHDPGTLQQQLVHLWNDGQMRKGLAEKGREKLKQFSWDKTYQEHIKLYESIL